MLNVKVITERHSSVLEEVFIKYILASSNKLYVIFILYKQHSNTAIVIFMLFIKSSFLKTFSLCINFWFPHLCEPKKTSIY